jgi:D-beta-D-heptose 7-phosphate kinase / D-beta-D-heptose 1-phosphate adenosyltransferase
MMIVIGDYIIDKYVMGTATRLSPEAPVPVIIPSLEETRPGGAANVVENLIALGHDPLFIYNDQAKSKKTRIVADGHLICRLDEERYEPFKFNLNAYQIPSNTRFAIISDYNKGVVHDPIDIIKQLKKLNINALVDPKKPFKYYNGAYLIKANKKEFEAEICEPFSEIDVALHCERLCNIYNFTFIVITLGADGCYVYSSFERRGYKIDAEKRTVIDVTGAGDVFMAVLAHHLTSIFVLSAARLANNLAGISVGHMGTYVLTSKDIQTEKKKTVFTNGCFDILHPGHIHLLKESKKLGDKLVVGLNSDYSVKMNKGATRPILSQDQRKKMLETLEIADEVIIFDEGTPINLIRQIRPDIITKGGDYKVQDVVGHDVAEVVIIPTVENYSTTGVINEINRKN